MSDYKGYHIEETPEGYKIYTSRDAWINGEEPIRRAVSLEVAQNWIDREVEIEAEGKFERVPGGVDITEFIKTLPFMPEEGEPLPEYVVRGMYPSPMWDLMESPVSEYGRQVVEETANRLREFMTGGNFILREKFSEEGWSSEDITYLGDLFHAPTRTLWLAQVFVVFEWREPSSIESITISLFKKMEVGAPGWDDVVWDGELTLEEGRTADKMLLELGYR